MLDIPFFAHQQLIVLRNKGLIDAEQIDEYIARDGYQAAGQALLEMTSEEIVQEIKTSGLRGRGGGGFPTGLKWDFCARAEGDIKYVLCNADEGDPGAFMDRSILWKPTPTRRAGRHVDRGPGPSGARQGYIYCRAEYPLAVRRLSIAINQAKEYGLLGEKHPGFRF